MVQRIHFGRLTEDTVLGCHNLFCPLKKVTRLLYSKEDDVEERKTSSTPDVGISFRGQTEKSGLFIFRE